MTYNYDAFNKKSTTSIEAVPMDTAEDKPIGLIDAGTNTYPTWTKAFTKFGFAIMQPCKP